MRTTWTPGPGASCHSRIEQLVRQPISIWLPESALFPLFSRRYLPLRKILLPAPTPFRPLPSTTIILSPVSSRRCWKSPLDCNPIEFLSSRAERGSNLLEVKARRGLRSRSSCQAVLCHTASCFCIPDFLCAVWHCIFRRLLVCVFLCLYACFRVRFSVDCCEGYGEFPPGFSSSFLFVSFHGKSGWDDGVVGE